MTYVAYITGEIRRRGTPRPGVDLTFSLIYFDDLCVATVPRSQQQVLIARGSAELLFAVRNVPIATSDVGLARNSANDDLDKTARKNNINDISVSRSYLK